MVVRAHAAEAACDVILLQVDLAVVLVQLRAPAVIYYASGRQLNVQAGLRSIPSHPRDQVPSALAL